MSSVTTEMLTFNAIHLRRISLVLLTVQNVTVALITRYVRTRSGDMFFSSSAVVMGELVKLFVCLGLITLEQSGSIRGMLRVLREQILRDPWDCVLISVPSLVYVIQNNLLYIAVSHLDAATFQVLYQLKILSTALFFRFMLHRELSIHQWFSLLILFVGVSLAQLSAISPSPNTAIRQATASLSLPEQKPWVGFSAIIVACCLSGFAGVFFEKLLKGSDKSIWLRNVQLAGLGIPIALASVVLQDGARVYEKGFFHGYDVVVVVVVLVQSAGGLLVAAVVKYADNVLKGFATSAAIILSAVFSMVLFHFQPGYLFLLGTTCVCMATVMYSSYPPKKKELPVTEIQIQPTLK